MKTTSFVLAFLLCQACGGSTSNESGGGSGGTGAGGGGSGGTSAGGTSGTGAVSGGGGSGAAGGSTSWYSCSDVESCLLMPTNCCGYCGPASLSGYQAVNATHAKDYAGMTCAEPQACPDCITYEEPNYLALCRAGSCQAVDLRLDALSACGSDGDCQLRWGASCCEDCGGTGLVAVSKSANLSAEVCSPLAGACPPCMPPPYPTTALPVCQAGHCAVKMTGLGGP